MLLVLLNSWEEFLLKLFSHGTSQQNFSAGQVRNGIRKFILKITVDLWRTSTQLMLSSHKSYSHNAGYKQGWNTNGNFIKSSNTPCPSLQSMNIPGMNAKSWKTVIANTQQGKHFYSFSFGFGENGNTDRKQLHARKAEECVTGWISPVRWQRTIMTRNGKLISFQCGCYI